MENSTRVLIVEDEPILALELKEDLQDMGFSVSEVIADGDMVLHAFLRTKPDVVLMDIKLHGFRDGIDSASQIRGFYKTPIVYLSSFAETDVQDRLTRTAPYVYLQKPYDLPRLQATIDQAVKGTA